MATTPAAHLPSGYTLIEMSIVLVIIGLIVGCVMVGEDLIHAAKIQKQIKQLQDYELAFNTFAQKYNCIPGDCVAATSFWPSAVNGNGNDIVDTADGGSYDSGESWSASTEMQQFFIQLSLAGLIQGHFDGTGSVGGGLPPLSLNTNATFIAGGSINFVASRFPDISSYRTGTNILWLVACPDRIPGTDNMETWDDACLIFSPNDAFAIDNKIDDGRPLSGRMLGFNGPGFGSISCLNYPQYSMGTIQLSCQLAYVLN